MWVEKTKRGYRLCDRLPVGGEIRRVSVPLEKNTAQARRKAQEALLEKARQIAQPKRKEGLDELVALYVQKKDCKESTRAVTRRNLSRIVEIIGEDCPLEPTRINRAIMEGGVKPHTVNVYIHTFRAFLRWIYRYGYISEDIASKVCTLRDKALPKASEEKYLEPEELRAVLDQLSGMYKYVCHFLALTGCRIGEAAALTIDDIDDHYIHITKTNSGYGITTPKTTSSKRDIFIQDELADLLREYKEWRLLYMMSCRIRTNLLFFSATGSPIRSSAMCSMLNKIPGKHLHPHIFRHTHTALLAEQGMSLEAISRRLGHEGSDITKEVYFHVTKKLKSRDEEAIRKIRIL